MKKSFWKNSFRAIKDNLSRFFSMISIVLLATGIITGLLITAPNMEMSMTDEFVKDNLLDINFISEIGFDEESVLFLKDKFIDVEGVGIFDKEVVLNENITLNSITYELDFSQTNINRLTIIEGNMPKNDTEIVIQRNDRAFVKVNDEIEIDSIKYTVSGIVKNSWYFSKEPEKSITSSSVSDLIIYRNNNNPVFYTNLFITIEKAAILNHFSNQYKKTVDDKIKELETLVPTVLEKRLAAIHNPMQIEDVNYYILNRSHNYSFQTYKTMVDKVNTITQIFPVFFLIVATLVVLTTMTRMIEEERQEIGIARSLGYKKNDIYGKYLVYATLVAVLGGGIGYAAGFRLIPSIINSTFTSVFYVADLNFEIFSLSNIIYIAIIVLSIMFTTVFVLRKTLRQNCSSLLLPKAPKHGKRILLEKIPFIWQKLKFKYKATLRNLFRYPNNLIMTVLGITGSLGLVFTGLALRNSLTAVTDGQYREILKYDFSLTLSSPVSNDLKDLFINNGYSYLITYEQSDFVTVKDSDETFYITIVVTNDDISNHINLVNRKTNVSLSLNNEGIIVTEQISEYLKLNVNDKLRLTGSDEMIINGVTENYISNYVYMTKEYYDVHFINSALTEKILVIADVHDEEVIKEKFMALDEVQAVSFLKDELETNKKLMNQIDVLSVVLILAAGFLAVIIIYNLTNVNISEREKELATLKVLGYKNSEVSNYVFREINIMTVIGIIFGVPVGMLLNSYVINSVDTPNTMLGRKIDFTTYIISIGLIIIFVIFVELIMHKKIKKIDMIGALKEL